MNRNSPIIRASERYRFYRFVGRQMTSTKVQTDRGNVHASSAPRHQPCVLVDRQGPVAVVTLNSPETRNAMSPEMSCRLGDAFSELRDDKSVASIVLTGSGGKAFCSGGDLVLTLPLLTGDRAPENEWDRRLLADASVLRRSCLQQDDFGKPIVAAVNGACLAGGFELLLGTDIRVAADHAIFGLPEVAHGLIPFAGAPTRLSRQIAHCFAMELMLTGAPIDAATAHRIGLVNDVVPAESVFTRAMSIAQRIASNGPLAVQTLKRTVQRASSLPFADGFAIEDEARRVVLDSQDAREGPRAFLEKRRPRFVGG